MFFFKRLSFHPFGDQSNLARAPRIWSVAFWTIVAATVMDLAIDLPLAIALRQGDIAAEIGKTLVFSTLFGIGMTVLTFRILISHQRTIDRLMDLARRDHQTKLLNHNSFMEEANESLADDASHVLLIGDIDRFKSINDTFGHQAGDRVILAVGKIISDLFGQPAVTGRLGGEEFGVLMPQPFADRLAGYHAAQAFAQEWRKRVESMTIEGVALPVTLSIGLARSEPNEGFESLYSRADRALYVAKTSGRNRVVMDEHMEVEQCDESNWAEVEIAEIAWSDDARAERILSPAPPAQALPSTTPQPDSATTHHPLPQIPAPLRVAT